MLHRLQVEAYLSRALGLTVKDGLVDRTRMTQNKELGNRGAFKGGVAGVHELKVTPGERAG